jgi:hypothetical protein
MVLAGCGKKTQDSPPAPAKTPVVAPAVIVDAAVVDHSALYRVIGQRVLAEVDAAFPAPPVPAAADDRNIPAIGECTRPDAIEQTGIQSLLPDGAWRFGCKDPDGIVVEQQFVREKGGHRDKGVWRVVRVNGKKVTKLGEVTGTPEVDWQEWAQENTLGVLVLADVDGDGARDVVMEQTSTEGGVPHHTSVLQLVRSTATKVTRLGELDAVVSVHLALGTKPGALIVGAFPNESDKEPTYKCITPAALADCPVAAQAAVAEKKRDLATWFTSATFTPPTDRAVLSGDLDLLGVQGDERARLLATLPAKN